MQAREQFVEILDPAEHRLKAIVRSYAFKDEINCGLKNCRQGHKKGYLVATESGLETNIGHKCGKKYFGADFQREHRNFQALLAKGVELETIARFQAQATSHLERAASLWHDVRGGWWVARCQAIFESHQTQTIRSQLRDMRNSGNWGIWRYENRTAEDDWAAGLGFRRDEQFARIRIGELRGLNATKVSAQEIVNRSLLEKIERFREIDFRLMRSPEIVMVARWCGGLEGKFRAAALIVQDGRRFFSSENLTEMKKLCKTAEDQKAIGAITLAIASLPLSQNM